MRLTLLRTAYSDEEFLSPGRVGACCDVFAETCEKKVAFSVDASECLQVRVVAVY